MRYPPAQPPTPRPSAESYRREVRDMHARGVITSGERADAMQEIDAGRGAAAVAFLRRQIAG